MSKKTGSRSPGEFRIEDIRLTRSLPEESIRQLTGESGLADLTLRSWVKQEEITLGDRESLAYEERSGTAQTAQGKPYHL